MVEKKKKGVMKSLTRVKCPKCGHFLYLYSDGRLRCDHCGYIVDYRDVIKEIIKDTILQLQGCAMVKERLMLAKLLKILLEILEKYGHMLQGL